MTEIPSARPISYRIVACPTCKAEEGEECRDTEKPGTSHIARVKETMLYHLKKK